LDFVQSTLTYTGTEGYDYLAYINETLKVKRILLSIQIWQNSLQAAQLYVPTKKLQEV